jgi:hypothetical protein
MYTTSKPYNDQTDDEEELINGNARSMQEHERSEAL